VNPAIADFRVDEDGNLFASSATISGTLVAATGTFNGVSIVYNHATSPTGVVVTGGFIKTASLGTRTGLVVADIDTTTEKQFTSYTWVTSVWVERISLNSSGYALFDGIFAGRGQGEYDSNTVFGFGALANNSPGGSGDLAQLNSAFGYQTLASNTDGHSNSAFGAYALTATTTGDRNSAFGRLSLQSNTTGVDSSAFGHNALSLSTGSSNCAFGSFSLDENTTGIDNNAFGHLALQSNTTGDSNCAFGQQSLSSLETGDNNTAVGQQSLGIANGGSNNLGLGHDAGRSTSPFEVTTESNRIILGDSNITDAYIKVAWTVTSDERDKADKAPLVLGLDFISDLTPISFVWDDRSRYWEIREDEVIKHSSDGSKKSEQINYGFSAQQVLVAEVKHGVPPNVIVNTEKEEKLLLKETALIPVLVNAIQELSARLAKLENK
jgi:hypothetical protein